MDQLIPEQIPPPGCAHHYNLEATASGPGHLYSATMRTGQLALARNPKRIRRIKRRTLIEALVRRRTPSPPIIPRRVTAQLKAFSLRSGSDHLQLAGAGQPDTNSRTERPGPAWPAGAT